jgi:hypothetical protein
VISPEHKQFIKDNYTKMTTVNISKETGINISRIRNYCYRERKKSKGKLFNKSERYYMKQWSDDSMQYLADNVGLKSYDDIALALDRNSIAIKVMIRKKGMSLYDNFYSGTTLSKELGKSKNTIFRWADRGLLPYKRAKFKGLYGRIPMAFVEDDIVKFIKEYYYKFNPKRIEHPYFRNIVINEYDKNKSKENAS